MKSRIVRGLLIAVGVLSVALGIIGLFLPVMPTMPFMLLAAACFVRSSEPLYAWLLSNRFFGRYLRSYREGRGIPVRIKIMAISALWLTITVSVVFFVPDSLWWVRIVMCLIAAAVTVHIVRTKPFP